MSASSSSAATGSSTGTSLPDIVFVYLHGIISESKSRRGKYKLTAEYAMREGVNKVEVEESTRSARSTVNSLVTNALKSIATEHRDTKSDHSPDFTELLEDAFPELETEARKLHPGVNFGASLIRFEELKDEPEALESIAEEEEGPDAGPGSKGGEESEGEEGTDGEEGSQDNESSDDGDGSVAGSDTGSQGEVV